MVTVVATDIASLTIAPALPSLLVGQTAQLSVVARDAAGNVIPHQPTAWSLDDATLATLSSSGMLIAVAEGTVTITGVVEQLTAVARIRITRDPPSVRFLQIAGGNEHTCAIAGGGAVPDGTAFCWGNGTSGQLGIGLTGYAAAPFRVTGLPTLTFIAAASNSTCAVTAAGEAYCWGENTLGQLGDGTTVNRTAPVRVATLLLFRAVALGGSFTCGLTGDGVAYCWGQIANTVVTVPTLVPGGIQFAELTGGGGGFVCGRATTGRAYCWGSTYSWARQTPTVAPGDVLFSRISAGLYHACAVAVADGQGYCWGRIVSQQMGPGVASGTREVPLLVPGGLRFTELAAGGSFTCGVTGSGSYCLGGTYLSNGQGPDPSPRPIPGESRHPFAAIVGGWNHACGIDGNGGGWCWGWNASGQVGAGEFQSTPTEPLQLRIR